MVKGKKLKIKKEETNKVKKEKLINGGFSFFIKSPLFFNIIIIFTILSIITLIILSFVLPARSINYSSIIENVKIKQFSTITIEKPVKWTALVKRSDINAEKYLVKLPKKVKNINISVISEAEAKNILSANLEETLFSKEEARASISYRKRDFFIRFKDFLFADLGQKASDAVTQFVDQIIEDNQKIIQTEDATIIDISEQAPGIANSPDSSAINTTPSIEPTSSEIPEEAPVEILEASSPPPILPEQNVEEQVDAPIPSVEVTPTPETSSPEETTSVLAITTEEASLSDQETAEVVEETPVEYVKIEYETPGPEIIEQETNTGKLVTISSTSVGGVDCESLNPNRTSILQSISANISGAFSNILSSLKKYLFANLEDAVSQILNPNDQNTETQSETPDEISVPTEAPVESIATSDVAPTLSETPEELPAEEIPAETPIETPVESIATSDVAPTLSETPVPVEEAPVEASVDEPTTAVEETPIASADEIAYQNCLAQQIPLTDVLAFTNIPEIYKVGQQDKIKIKWKNNSDQEMTFTAYDTDDNGYLDYVEWTVPHLSEQIFEIIFISRAFQLDSNHNILADIYSETQAQDDVWAQLLNGQYVRVTFEKILDNTKDITTYAKPQNNNNFSTIEVYPVYTDSQGNQTEGPKIATFENIDHEGTYKILLTNLETPTDVFDLKIIGDTDIDYIVDPTPTAAYWVGGTGDWSDATNHWATSSNGTPDAGNLPGTVTICHFDSNSGTGTTSIDANISVLSIATTADFGGTIQQNSTKTITVGTSGWTQAGGTFTGGDSAITINGSFNLSGGTFTSTQGTLEWCKPQGGTSSISGTGNFEHNNGKTLFTLHNHTLDVNTTLDLYDVELAKNNGYALVLPTGDTVVVNGVLTLTDGLLTGTGIFNAKGSISVSANFDGGNVQNSGATVIVIDGTVDQSFTIPNGAKIPGITLNNSLTTISFASNATAYIHSNFTLQAGVFTSTSGTLYWCSNQNGTSSISGGTFNHNGGTIIFSTYNHTLNVGGTSFTANNVTIAKASNSYTQTISNGTLIVDGTLTLTYGLLAGAITANGATVVNSTAGGGTGTISYTVTGDQTITTNGGIMPNVTVNKSSGTVSVTTGTSSNLTVRNFTISQGTFTSTSGLLNINGNFTNILGGTFNHNDGTVAIGSYPTATIDVDTTEIFYNLTTKGFAQNTCNTTISSGDTLVVLGTYTMSGFNSSNRGTINTGTVEARGDVVIDSFTQGGDATISFLVAGDQTITSSSGWTGNLNINKPSGTVTVTGDLDIRRFTLSSGTFTSTSGTLSTSGNFTHTAGGIFNHNNGTVKLGSFTEVATVDVATTETFNNLKTAGYGSRPITISSGDTLVVLNTLTMSGFNSSNRGTINTGTIEARGDVVEDEWSNGGTAKVIINGTGSQTFTGNVTLTGNLPKVEISKTSGTLYLAGTIRTGNDWTYTQGNLDVTANDSTVIFIAGATPPVVTGSHTLDNVRIDNGTSSTRTLTIASGTVLTTVGTLTIDNTSTGTITINTGTLSAESNVVVGAGPTAYNGTAILFFSGSNTQSFDLTGAEALLDLDIKVNKSGGQVNLASTLTMNAANQDLIIEEGTFDINGNPLAVSGTGSTFIVESGGNIQLQGGETITAPTLQSGSTATYDGAGGTIKDWTYTNAILKLIGTGGAFVFDASKTVAGFILGPGAVGQITSGQTLTVSGNFTSTATTDSHATLSAVTPSSVAYMPVSGTATVNYVDGTDIDSSGGTLVDNSTGGTGTRCVNWYESVSNTLPVASSVSIDSGAVSVTLTEGTTRNVVCAGVVTDTNGYADITSVTAKFYKTGTGADAGDDNANHYTLTGEAQCIPSGGSGNTENYTCTFAVQFYADPTDDGSPDSADNWTCQMTPTDTVGAGTADTDTIEMASLTALSVTSTINYSSLALGGDTESTDQTTVVTNTGNRTIDSQVDGYGAIDGDGYSMTCTIGAVTIGNEKYSLSASTAYASKTALTDTAFQLTSFNLAKGASSTKNIYWGMGLPSSGVGSNCTGSVVFTAVNH